MLLYPLYTPKDQMPIKNPTFSRPIMGPEYGGLSPRRFDRPRGLADAARLSPQSLVGGAADGSMFFNLEGG